MKITRIFAFIGFSSLYKIIDQFGTQLLTFSLTDDQDLNVARANGIATQDLTL